MITVAAADKFIQDYIVANRHLMQWNFCWCSNWQVM